MPCRQGRRLHRSTMCRVALLLLLATLSWNDANAAAAAFVRHFLMGSRRSSSFVNPSMTGTMTTALTMTNSNAPPPKTFREAEVLGLKFMQEGNYQDALDAFQNGLKLPGSRSDILRNKSLSGPSPVGGSTGGFDSVSTKTLDEFELQAAHYNIACACAQLGRPDESLQALQAALEYGFDNYGTVRSDPDLDPIKSNEQFESLMQQYEPKNKKNGGGGFNPFGLFKSS